MLTLLGLLPLRPPRSADRTSALLTVYLFSSSRPRATLYLPTAVGFLIARTRVWLVPLATAATCASRRQGLLVATAKDMFACLAPAAAALAAYDLLWSGRPRALDG